MPFEYGSTCVGFFAVILRRKLLICVINCMTADGILPSRRSPYKALRRRGCLRLTSQCGRLCGLEERLTCEGVQGECSVPEHGRVRGKSGETDDLPRQKHCSSERSADIVVCIAVAAWLASIFAFSFREYIAQLLLQAVVTI